LLTPAESDRLCVVLVSTRNPLNIGAAARAMSNFGLSRLRVVNPFEESFREARSAVGASSVLQAAEQYQSVAQAVADCSLVIGTTAGRNRDVKQPLVTLPEGGPIVREHLAAGRVAILFGSEKRGLSNDDFTHCHWLVSIPTREQHPSMNLGQAVAVCLYELTRGSGAADKPEAQERANAGELEQITTTMFEMLEISGYVKPRSGASSLEKLRRLVRRMNLDPADAELLLGMLRKIEWKLKSSTRG
jgi:TrmH family RNA methyltransferase